MIPYKTIIHFDRKAKAALFLQLAEQIISLIKNNTLSPKTQLPGSRDMALQLSVHRKTIVAAYEELSIQGWIKTIPKKGTFVNDKLPIQQYQEIRANKPSTEKEKAAFPFKNDTANYRMDSPPQDGITIISDGTTDTRLTPLNDIAKTYRRLAAKKNAWQQLSYSSPYGHQELRKTLTEYLNNTRGLKITSDQILITRGSQMGIFLSARLLAEKGDYIIVGASNYTAADICFQKNDARLLRVKVDQYGIDTKQVEAWCKKHPVKAIYLTPHHHHPTTVTLSAERRLHLLHLSKTYKFAIIEDDYDYDFHYNRAPILPLASHDSNGNVIYIGSICKTVAPAFRVGYMVAPKAFIDACAMERRYIDRQGDTLLELSFADFIKSGDLDRHINKVHKIYKARRDFLCKLLRTELSKWFDFDVPQGGIAIWFVLNKKYS